MPLKQRKSTLVATRSHTSNGKAQKHTRLTKCYKAKLANGVTAAWWLTHEEHVCPVSQSKFRQAVHQQLHIATMRGDRWFTHLHCPVGFILFHWGIIQAAGSNDNESLAPQRCIVCGVNASRGSQHPLGVHQHPTAFVFELSIPQGHHVWVPATLRGCRKLHQCSFSMSHRQDRKLGLIKELRFNSTWNVLHILCPKKHAKYTSRCVSVYWSTKYCTLCAAEGLVEQLGGWQCTVHMQRIDFHQSSTQWVTDRTRCCYSTQTNLDRQGTKHTNSILSKGAEPGAT